MSLTKAALRKLGRRAHEMQQDYKHRPRCVARSRGRSCGRPMHRDYGHCGRHDCAMWLLAQDDDDVKFLLNQGK